MQNKNNIFFYLFGVTFIFFLFDISLYSQLNKRIDNLLSEKLEKSLVMKMPIHFSHDEMTLKNNPPLKDHDFIKGIIEKWSKNKTQKTTLNKSSIESYDVDSIIVHSTTDTFKLSFSYNVNGDKLNGLYEKWRNGEWMFYYRYTFTYDEAGRKVSHQTDQWIDGQWVNYIRYTVSYDENGNRVSGLHEQWKDNKWEGLSLHTYQYNALGQMLLHMSEQWIMGERVKVQRWIYTYETNGMINSVIDASWFLSGSWVNRSRDVFAYDANGKMLSDLFQRWKDMQWVDSTRSIYMYDTKGNLLSDLFQHRKNMQWVDSTRSTYMYDENSNQLSKLEEVWANEWINYYRCTNTYDDGRELTMLDERWDGNQWINAYNYAYKYDLSGNMILFNSEQWFSSTWKLYNGQYKITDRAGNDVFLSGYEISLHYKLAGAASATEEIGTLESYRLDQNYPNPFNPSTSIQYAVASSQNVKVVVYNSLGQMVKTFDEGDKEAGSYTINFNGEGLSSGVYLYSINMVSVDGKQNFRATKKMLLIK